MHQQNTKPDRPAASRREPGPASQKDRRIRLFFSRIYSPGAPPAPGSGSTRPVFRRDIEGLRALAILFVVGYHGGVPGFGGGYVGVDVFFTLSGYLITTLLLNEAERTGTVDLLGFYARRARRLLPAAALMLAVTVVVGAIVFAPVEQRVLGNAAIATAAYLSNLYFAAKATDYLGAAAETNPLLHTWSLSVEEQFYLVWPCFVLFGLGILRGRGRPDRRRLLGWMAGLTVVSFLASVYLTGVRQPWAFFLSPLRAWEFSAGALLALAPPLRGSGLAGRAAPWLGWAGLAGMFAGVFSYDESTLFPGAAALLPVVATMLVLHAGGRGGETALARALGVRPLQEIGRLSYSWYLWHWPVLVFAAASYGPLPLPHRLGMLALSLALAEGCYRLVENPIRHSRVLSARPARSLGLAVGITVLGIGLAALWRDASSRWALSPAQVRYTQVKEDLPEVYANGCHRSYTQVEIELERCTTGPADAPGTLVLFGDSHAAHWHPALAELVSRRGWRLISLTKSGCPAVDVPLINPAIGREYTECATWRANALTALADLRPDLVVLASSRYEALGEQGWYDGTSRLLGQLSPVSERVVLVRDVPHLGFDAPGCLARGLWSPRFLPRTDCDPADDAHDSEPVYQAQRRAAAHFPNVRTADLTPHVCPAGGCELERDGVLVYRDSNHLTASFARRLSAVLADELSLKG